MTSTPLLPDDRTTNDLVVRARVDRKAFGDLYDTIYPSIFRYCLRRVGNRSLAEDITSTVFLSVAKKIPEFGGETFVEFRRWIFTIATNEINADYRKTARRQQLSIEAAQSGRLRSEESDADADAEFDGSDLQVAITRLSERAQAVITMRFFSELSYEEIGKILKLSHGAVRTAASRALVEIRNELRTE